MGKTGLDPYFKRGKNKWETPNKGYKNKLRHSRMKWVPKEKRIWDKTIRESRGWGGEGTQKRELGDTKKSGGKQFRTGDHCPGCWGG